MPSVNSDELQQYLSALLERLDQEEREPYLDRRFESVKDFGRISVDVLRFKDISQELSPNLDTILENSRAVVSGEPGSGKTVVTLEAAKRLALRASTDAVPIRGALKSYRGDLTKLLSSSAATILAADNLKRVYLLDGLDELPRDSIDAFRKNLEQLLSQDQHARLVLTSRQAFLAGRPSLVPPGSAILRVLPFGESNIRDYASWHGVDPDSFQAELDRQGLTDDAGIPFVLSCLVEQYSQAGRLPPLKSDNVDFVISRLIDSRPAVPRTQQRRSLRMLGIAMEICSRNELTLDEATRVLTSAMNLSEERARVVLDELDRSILLRTPTGIGFQLASYGEFLAAQELENQSMDRVCQLAFVNNHPNDSWVNTVSYLAELNPDVRKYFSLRHPEWMVASSPTAFEDSQKDQIVRKILSNLDNSHQLLRQHPILKARALERFLTTTTRAELRDSLNDARPTRVANALILLGLSRDPSVVDVALPIVIDRSKDDALRLCAISALENAGDHRLVDTLIENLNKDDPFHMQVLDCIGALTEPNQLPRVLPLLLSTDTVLSAAYYHFYEWRSREAVVETLQVLIDDPAGILSHIRAGTYVEPLLRLLHEYMDAEVAQLCADMIVSSENSHVFLRNTRLASVFVEGVKKSGYAGTVARLALTRLIESSIRPICSGNTLGFLLDRDSASWLAENGSEEIVRPILRTVHDPEVRAILTPTAGYPNNAQLEAIDSYHSSLEQQRQEELESLQRVVVESDDISQVLHAADALQEEHWPDVQSERVEWLSTAISQVTIQMDLRNRIIHTGGSWTVPLYFHPVLGLIRRYTLLLQDDVPLVHALRAWPERSVVEYYNRVGFSANAIAELERYLADRTVAGNEQYSFVRFLEATGYWSARVADNLKRIALDDSVSASTRTTAIRALNRDEVPDDVFEELLFSNNPNVHELAFSTLVQRQHRPTIEKELSRLSTDVRFLQSIEQEGPFQLQLDWLGSVSSPWAARGLSSLRGIALEHSLPNVAERVTQTLARIVPREIACIVRDQIQFAPDTWRSSQESLALECERNSRIQAALDLPFDQVLAKLKQNTSMIAVKVYVEGATDKPVIKRLLDLAGERELAKTIDLVGGWPNLLAQDDPLRWLDGCREAAIIMDGGGGGRDLQCSEKPFANNARKALRLFQGYPIKLHVLNRHGIEHYFPHSVCEKVLKRNLSAYFPIPDHVPIDKHFSEPGTPSSFYNKSLNERIAELLQLQDIENSDLRSIIDAIREQARALT